MKKQLLMLAILGVSLGTNAQITVERTDFAVPGDWFVLATDESISELESNALKAAGANKLWNFKSFERTQKDTTFFADGNNYPTAPEGCNLVSYTRDPNTLEEFPSYFDVDQNWLKIILDDSDLGALSGGLKVFKFPSTLGTNYKDSVESSFTSLATDLGFPENPLFDSAKISFTIVTDNKIDAHGFVELPAGMFEVLRQKEQQQVKVGVKLRNVITRTYIDIPLPGDLGGFGGSTTSYTWIGKNSGYFYAQAFEDTLGAIGQVDFMIASSKGVSGLKDMSLDKAPSKVFPVPATDRIIIEAVAKKGSKAALTIYDILGNKVGESLSLSMHSGLNQLLVEINHLTPGVYFYLLEGDVWQSSNRFVVK
ncbi:MAG: T9SS type A sorting domain-containing protein [Bacteroidetes bacterium]|nr:T9SS type A sorting domain-containing protein [Bacteroidota bacterium]